jgi:hypothetical protein
MTDELPRWQSRDQRERQQMERWVHSKMDALLDQQPPISGKGGFDALMLTMTPIWIDMAVKSRDLDRLMQLTEDKSARRILIERLFRGSGRPAGITVPSQETGLMEYASRCVDWVRQLWREHYDGKQKRERDDGPSAEEIVTRWFQLRSEELSRPEMYIKDGVLELYRQRNGRSSSPNVAD